MKKYIAVLLLMCLTLPSFSLTMPSWRNIKDKPVTDIRDYGCLPDDGVDDTASITAAMTNGAIYIPPGTYEIASLTVPNSCLGIFGGGWSSYLKVADNSTGLIVDATSNGQLAFLNMGNFTLIGSGSHTAIGASVKGPYVNFNNVTFESIGTGILCFSSSTELSVIDCKFTDCTTGINIPSGGGINNKISLSRFSACGVGLSIDDTLSKTEGVQVIDSHFFGCSSGIVASGSEYTFVTNCVIDLTHGTCINLYNAGKSRVSNCYLAQSLASVMSAGIVATGDTNGIIIDGCIFEWIWGYGVEIYGQSIFSDCLSISNCRFNYCNYGAATNGGRGDIQIVNAYNAAISNCHFGTTDAELLAAGVASVPATTRSLTVSNSVVTMSNSNVLATTTVAGTGAKIRGNNNRGFVESNAGLGTFPGGSSSVNIAHGLSWSNNRGIGVWITPSSGRDLFNVEVDTTSFTVSLPYIATYTTNFFWKAEMNP